MEKPETSSAKPIESRYVRPNFLAVLCILTFTGSTWGIISGTKDYLSANTSSKFISAAMQDAKEDLQQSGDPDARKNIVQQVDKLKDPERRKKNAIYAIIACSITLLGGILMFQQKRTGYYAYLLGTGLGIAGPFVAFAGVGFLGIFLASVWALLGLVFVVLYTLNLKHLR